MCSKAASLTAATWRQASRCEASASALQVAKATWHRSAEDTTSGPRERTSSKVPPSTQDTVGSVPPGQYSIAT